MSNINVKRFVDINIVPHISAQNVGTIDTVLLFTEETNSSLGERLIRSLEEAKTYCGYTDEETIIMSDTYAYLKMYFNNGGVNAYVYPDKESDELGEILLANNFFSGVDMQNNPVQVEYVCVAFASGPSAQSADYSELLDLATDRASSSSIYGVNQKLILTRATSIVDPSVKNFIVKYSSVPGAEMTIAAYLSKINTYRYNTVYDYMFTPESIDAEDITDTEYNAIIESQLNVDIKLAGLVRNCGGNCTDGDDIVNAFLRIVLQQTLTNAILQTLVQKLKNQSGLNKIYSAMANELEKYRNCGYLTTDKVWGDDDLYITYNNENYLIIEKGTAIQNGYFIKILPFNSLSTTDKTARNTPPIYVIIAEQYGIRKITINGEAI